MLFVRYTLLQEFGGNVDKDIERIHYLNSPFVARFVRFHPKDWNRHISMRAGLLGCPHRGTKHIHTYTHTHTYAHPQAYELEGWVAGVSTPRY